MLSGKYTSNRYILVRITILFVRILNCKYTFYIFENSKLLFHCSEHNIIMVKKHTDILSRLL